MPRSADEHMANETTQAELLNCRKPWYNRCYRARTPKAGAATNRDEREATCQRSQITTVNKRVARAAQFHRPYPSLPISLTVLGQTEYPPESFAEQRPVERDLQERALPFARAQSK